MLTFPLATLSLAHASLSSDRPHYLYTLASFEASFEAAGREFHAACMLEIAPEYAAFREAESAGSAAQNLSDTTL